ncbi:hypothetical protein KI387_027978, partial [Taxus chinensis]
MQIQMKSSESVWDCGSSLYDSFELSVFSEQLNRAMAEGEEREGLSSSSCIMKDAGRARSVSMPHYAAKREDRPLPSKTSTRFGIPKSVQRLFTRAFHTKAKHGTKPNDFHSKLGNGSGRYFLTS